MRSLSKCAFLKFQLYNFCLVKSSETASGYCWYDFSRKNACFNTLESCIFMYHVFHVADHDEFCLNAC
jgi:hypothetical protein